MTNLPSTKPISLEEPLPNGQRLAEYSTLKKSLSASCTHPPESFSKYLREGSEKRQDVGSRSSVSILSNPPLTLDIPNMPSAAEAAFAALLYLPTPLLVLSSLKTVILANEAVGRLLGLDATHLTAADGDREEISVVDKLRGQSLSQLGIDMIQDGQQIWVSWEV